MKYGGRGDDRQEFGGERGDETVGEEGGRSSVGHLSVMVLNFQTMFQERKQRKSKELKKD